MPFDDRQFEAFAEIFQAPKLVVNECLEWTNVKDGKAVDVLEGDSAEDRQKSGLCLPGGGSRRQYHIILPVQDAANRFCLDIAEFVPTFVPDPMLNLLIETIEWRRLRVGRM